MKRIVYLFTLMALSLGGASVYADLPQVGSVVQGSVQVGPSTIPLPAGSWTVLKADDTQETRKVTFKKDPIGHVPVYKVVLAQAQQGMLAGIIEIKRTSNFEAKETYSSPHPITLDSAYHAESFFTVGNARGKPSAMFVEPYHFSSGVCGGVVKSFMEHQNLAASNTTFVAVVFHIVKVGTDLKVKYVFNPGVEGASLSRDHANAGRWHPEQHEFWDQKEKAVVEHYAQWAKGFQPQVISSLGN